jgi:hypothetical protein
MRLEHLTLAAACFAWSVLAAAQSAIPQTQEGAGPMPGSTFESEFDDDTKSWKEIQGQLPPAPKPENLARVQTGSATSNLAYVDTAAISIGADGVTRFTLVLKTSGGATNVTYEGMRCQTREQKLYAIGHRDGSWARARATEWRRVVLRDLQPYYHTLYHEFFCPAGVTPTPVKDAVQALKRGRGLSSRSASDG